jgi:hypothetical protein
VTYADNSVYQYNVMSVKPILKTLTTVTAVEDTAYLVVTLDQKAAIVNGYTGEVIATKTYPLLMTNRGYLWARSYLGL